ncbi:MAG: GNAT family protein [Pseudomonadota bacterium]
MTKDFSTWRPCDEPRPAALTGRFVRLEAFSKNRHAQRLFENIAGPDDDNLWRYIPLPKPADAAALGDVFTFMGGLANNPWRVLAIIDPETDYVLGTASYMRIRPDHGSAEVGCVIFSKKIQKTPAATEAMFLMAKHLFDDLGYRRYEWKCHNGNDASKRAAERLGFSFEGVFRNDMIVKGENRDTAWYSIIDSEWPPVKAGLQAWLAPENFDEQGVQRTSLAALRPQH